MTRQAQFTPSQDCCRFSRNSLRRRPSTQMVELSCVRDVGSLRAILSRLPSMSLLAASLSMSKPKKWLRQLRAGSPSTLGVGECQSLWEIGQL